MATMAPSRPEELSLPRSLLCPAGKFPDYNIREYARRRAVDSVIIAASRMVHRNRRSLPTGRRSSRSANVRPLFTPSTLLRSRVSWSSRAHCGVGLVDRVLFLML